MITVENLTKTHRTRPDDGHVHYNATDQAADERQEAARRYVEELRAFYVHAAVFAAGMTAIFAVNLLTNLSAGIASEWSAWWSVWALIGWGAGIAVHGLVVRLNRPSLASSTWEQQQIERMLGR